MQQDITLQPIGIVHSCISKTANLPIQGVEAEIEVFDRYVKGLEGIEGCSHLFVLCWLHQCERDILLVKSRKITGDLPSKGVFSFRSNVRPNPISLTPTRLLGRKGNRLKVIIDVIDETPVIDLKGYLPGWDSVGNAEIGYMTPIYLKLSDKQLIDVLTLEAVNFHGEECAGLTIGVKIALKVMRKLNTGMRDPELEISVKTGGCLIDTVQGFSGATVGNGRLLIKGTVSLNENEYVAFVKGNRRIRIELKPYSHLTSEQAAMMDYDDIFTLIEE